MCSIVNKLGIYETCILVYILHNIASSSGLSLCISLNWISVNKRRKQSWMTVKLVNCTVTGKTWIHFVLGEYLFFNSLALSDRYIKNSCCCFLLSFLYPSIILLYLNSGFFLQQWNKTIQKTGKKTDQHPQKHLALTQQNIRIQKTNKKTNNNS